MVRTMLALWLQTFASNPNVNENEMLCLPSQDLGLSKVDGLDQLAYLGMPVATVLDKIDLKSPEFRTNLTVFMRENFTKWLNVAAGLGLLKKAPVEVSGPVSYSTQTLITQRRKILQHINFFMLDKNYSKMKYTK